MLYSINYTTTTEIYTLSLHDALPIFGLDEPVVPRPFGRVAVRLAGDQLEAGVVPFGGGIHGYGAVRTGHRLVSPSGRVGGADRKSTRLNSSHGYISYAVFCLKKKKQE